MPLSLTCSLSHITLNATRITEMYIVWPQVNNERIKLEFVLQTSYKIIPPLVLILKANRIKSLNAEEKGIITRDSTGIQDYIIIQE